MGDKSPKAKERGNKQKLAAATKDAAAAKSKRDSNNRALTTAVTPKSGR